MYLNVRRMKFSSFFPSFPALRLLVSSSSVAHLQLLGRPRGGFALAHPGGIPLCLVLPLRQRQQSRDPSLGHTVPRGGVPACLGTQESDLGK